MYFLKDAETREFVADFDESDEDIEVTSLIFSNVWLSLADLSLNVVTRRQSYAKLMVFLI